MGPIRTPRSIRSCMAAQFVIDLQTIVSRETKPTEPAVVTVGSIHGGTKHNIIGNECHLQLTVRSYSDEVRQHIHDAIIRKAKAVAAGAGAPEPKSSFPKARRPCSTTKNWRHGCGPFSSGNSARTTSMIPSRAWGARISACMARPACRS